MPRRTVRALADGMAHHMKSAVVPLAGFLERPFPPGRSPAADEVLQGQVLGWSRGLGLRLLRDVGGAVIFDEDYDYDPVDAPRKAKKEPEKRRYDGGSFDVRGG